MVDLVLGRDVRFELCTEVELVLKPHKFLRITPLHQICIPLYKCHEGWRVGVIDNLQDIKLVNASTEPAI